MIQEIRVAAVLRRIAAYLSCASPECDGGGVLGIARRARPGRIASPACGVDTVYRGGNILRQRLCSHMRSHGRIENPLRQVDQSVVTEEAALPPPSRKVLPAVIRADYRHHHERGVSKKRMI